MEWFNGGVREAIAAAQAKKTVFVVVVTGRLLSLGKFTKYKVVAFLNSSSLQDHQIMKRRIKLTNC